MAFFLVLLGFNVAQSATKSALYAIISPMPVEAEYIRSQMSDKKEVIKLGITYLGC